VSGPGSGPAAALEPELLGWAVHALAEGPGDVAAPAVGLREGGSPWRIELATGQAGVLRVLPASAAVRLRTELAALEHAAAHGLPVPRVLAADPDGAVVAGTIAVLTTVLPGTSHTPGAAPPLARFRALGAVAATIAAVPAPPVSTALPERTRSIPDVDFAALRRAAPERPLLVAAEEVVAEQVPPPRPPVFVHGDLWQGNTLWDADGGLTGIVDWDSAGVGPAGIDLGSLRCDAATSSGARAAAAVLAGYERVLGRPADDVAYWDVVAALCTPPEVGWFVDAVRDQGRTDLDQPTLLRRRDAFLRAALDRLL
jgi:aminoglycoside phosphotransferase (APT) family kinase protein